MERRNKSISTQSALFLSSPSHSSIDVLLVMQLDAPVWTSLCICVIPSFILPLCSCLSGLMCLIVFFVFDSFSLIFCLHFERSSNVFMRLWSNHHLPLPPPACPHLRRLPTLLLLLFLPSQPLPLPLLLLFPHRPVPLVLPLLLLCHPLLSLQHHQHRNLIIILLLILIHTNQILLMILSRIVLLNDDEGSRNSWQLDGSSSQWLCSNSKGNFII